MYGLKLCEVKNAITSNDIDSNVQFNQRGNSDIVTHFAY